MCASSTGNSESLRSSPPLQGERVAFTGTLASMTHRQARALAEEHGGVATEHVSRQTTMLVVGEEGWPLEPDGEPSRKLRQVEEWQREGGEIRILPESDWLRLLGLNEQREEIHRLYTPAMLSRLLDVSVGAIRRWERSGLIRAVRKVYRLPYFDFQEVAGARRLAELLEAGVPRRQIERSLQRLEGVLDDVERPLAQLDLLARGSRVVYRDNRGLVEPVAGQRVFDFDESSTDPTGGPDDDADDASPLPFQPQVRDVVQDADLRVRWTADEWFNEGCRLLDENEPGSAVEAFRMALTIKPGDAEVNFHLAEALYRSGNASGALERYYAAAEADHNYLEAWTQIGCLHAEKNELEAALEAFRIALNVHSDYPDAHWHIAEVLRELGRTEEAVPHWKAYLQFDTRGPWAENARQQLEEAGAFEDSLV